MIYAQCCVLPDGGFSHESISATPIVGHIFRRDRSIHVFGPGPARNRGCPLGQTYGYWNLTCALYAYIFGELTRMGVDVAGESQLVGYPTQFPSVSMVDWNTGMPNSRIRVLSLLRENFGPGDKIVETEPFNRSVNSYLYSLAVVKPDDKRRILLINKRDRPFEITVPGATGGQEEYVDQTTGFDPPGSTKLASEKITLNGLGVAVVTLP